jgi:hypothetical protein
MFGQIFAGTGLGLLVGILVGLSSSPVVATVVSALAAGMVTLLGFSKQNATDDDNYKDRTLLTSLASRDSALRLGSFGVACTIAVVFALFLRTHNWASPSISDQIAEVQRAGYTPDEAHRWVAYRNLGPVLYASAGQATTTAANGDKASSPPAATSGAAAAQSFLFASGNEGQCQYFDTTRYSNPQEHINALRLMGGKYAEYADKIATMGPEQQKTVLDSLRLLFCPL